MVRVYAAIAIGCLAGCFTPEVQQCSVACSAAGGCPPGSMCLADNFCHASTAEALCGAAGDASVADADPGAPDADPNAPDADPNAPDAAPPIPMMVGQLVVTEVLKDPCAEVMGSCTVADTAGEWFEVHNPTTTDFDLQGLLFRDDPPGQQQFIVNSSLIIFAGGHLVFGVDDDTTSNGGAVVDFEYPSSFVLSNSSADQIEIVYIGANPDVIIDRVEWNRLGFPPGDRGDAVSLDPGSYDAAANDDENNWCDAPTQFGDGDNGSPGSVNPDCN